MNKKRSIGALLLCGLLLFSACGKENAPNTAAADTTVADAGDETPASTGLNLVYKPKSGSEKTVSGDTDVELEISRAYRTGDKITVTLPEGQHYLALCLAKGIVEEAILYLPNSVFTYTAQNTSVSYPSQMNGAKCTLTARIPSDEELAASRNLALNPADLIDAENVFPHATATSVCRIDDETSRLQFESRNIIDGFTQNNGHGNYPYQSWGPESTMSRTDYMTIHFGREVTLSELIVYIRADFPHDTYWTGCTVTFSDGSSMQLDLTDSASAQSFPLEAPVTTSYIKFNKFNKANGEWAAWMEVQAIGSDIVG